jgi:hypothetical protein
VIITFVAAARIVVIVVIFPTAIALFRELKMTATMMINYLNSAEYPGRRLT